MKCLVQSLANDSHQKMFISHCFLWIPLLDDAFSATIWSYYCFAQNYSLALSCLQNQFYTSMLEVPRFCMVGPQSLLYLLLRIHFCTFSQDFIPSRNVFLLTLPLFKHSGHIQINFHMIFLSISAHDLSLFLWILFVLVCKHCVDIYSHTADIICFMSAGHIFPIEW